MLPCCPHKYKMIITGEKKRLIELSRDTTTTHTAQLSRRTYHCHFARSLVSKVTSRSSSHLGFVGVSLGGDGRCLIAEAVGRLDGLGSLETRHG